MQKTKKQERSYNKGRLSESIACFLLHLKGYDILERNYITYKGTGQNEIDIIACRGDTLCFIEVKYRKNKEDKFYAINYETKQRIVKAAKSYIAFHPEYVNFNVRFDALLMSRFSFPMHIADCWGENI